MKFNRVNKKEPVKNWRIALLQFQELPKAFGWDPVANTTTPALWHLMQQTKKLTEQQTVLKRIKNIQILQCRPAKLKRQSRF